MTPEQIIKGLSRIANVAEYTFTDDDFSTVVWLTDGVKPTLAEVEAAYEVYLQDKAQAELNRAAAKTALLEQLGITEDQAKLLLS